MSALSSSTSSRPVKTLTVVSQTTLDAVGNTGRYSGSILVETGLPHGSVGEMQYTSTSTTTTTTTTIPPPVSWYKGNWRHGKWHGIGVCHMPNGDSYDGQHVAGERHGHGKYVWHATCRSYEGEFHHNQRHGHGIYRWNIDRTDAEQSTYTGSFLQGQRQGHGTYQTPILEYTGEWWAGKYHGYGVISYHGIKNNSSSSTPSNSDPQKQYRGHFQNGKKHGYGVETNADGTIRHDGNWKEDAPILPLDQTKNVAETNSGTNMQVPEAPQPFTQVVQSEAIVDALGHAGMYRGILQDGLPQGVGTMVYQANNNQNDPSHYHHGIQEYEGFWEQGRTHGFGRLKMENGDAYEGNLVQGKRQGRGQYKWKDGRHYKGMWSNDRRHGTGVFLYPNNDMFEGEFVNGKREGQGRFVFCDGSVYVGEWKDGLYDGQGKLVMVDGKVYQGSFQGGWYHGQGKEVDDTGTIIYEGEWVRGRPAGEEEPEPLDFPSKERQQDRLPQSLPASASTSPAHPNTSTTATQRVVTPSSLISKFLGPTSGSKSESISSTYSTTASSLLSVLQAPFLSSALSSSTTATTSANKPPSQPQTLQTPEEDHRAAVVDVRCWDAQNNPGRYTGLLHSTTEQPHGVGRMVYDDRNRIHEGFWDHGHREGHGRCVFLNIGDFHEGDYVQNLRHGPGKYLWKDGRAFTGNYHKDERQGQGVFTYPNGDVYRGNFADGQRSGYGTFAFHNGACQYKGEWKEGVYDGKGLLEWKANDDGGEQITHLYVGEFAGGVLHGQGKESVDGQVEREGIWNQGKFVHQSMTSEKVANGAKEQEPETSVALGQVAKEIAYEVGLMEDTPHTESPQDDGDNEDMFAPPTELEKQTSAPIECPTNLEHNYEDERQEWRNALDLA
jgi:hypothetical protein